MLTQRDKNMLKFMERYGGLTIRQAYKMFYNDRKSGEQMSRKRLKKLCDFGFCKYFTNPASDERVYYYLDKKISPHDVYLLDFYSNLIFYGAEVLEFRKEPSYELGERRIQPDGFFKYKYHGFMHGCFVEIDFTHASNLIRYTHYYNNGYFEELYGGNPFIAIVTQMHKNYKTSLDVVYMNFDMLDFASKILID